MLCCRECRRLHISRRWCRWCRARLGTSDLLSQAQPFLKSDPLLGGLVSGRGRIKLRRRPGGAICPRARDDGSDGESLRNDAHTQPVVERVGLTLSHLRHRNYECDCRGSRPDRDKRLLFEFAECLFTVGFSGDRGMSGHGRCGREREDS